MRVGSLLSCPTCARNIATSSTGHFLTASSNAAAHASASVTRGIAAFRNCCGDLHMADTKNTPPERVKGASKGDIIGPGGGRPKTFRRASASKVLPVALLSMRPLFVGANRHYSTVCHNAIRWFYAVCRTGAYYAKRDTTKTDLFRSANVFQTPRLTCMIS